MNVMWLRHSITKLLLLFNTLGIIPRPDFQVGIFWHLIVLFMSKFFARTSE